MSKPPAALPSPGDVAPPVSRSFRPRLQSSKPIQQDDPTSAIERIAARRRGRAAPDASQAVAPTVAAPAADPATRPAVDPATELGVTPSNPLAALVRQPAGATPGAGQPVGATPGAGQPVGATPERLVVTPTAAALAGIGADTPVAVVIDGKVENIPLGELQRGYIRQRDYSAKTEQLAVAMRQAQDMHTAFNKARETLEARLPEVLQGLQDEFAQPIDWQKLAREDPIGYAQKDARYKSYIAARQEAENLVQLRRQEAEAREATMLASANEFLNQNLPGWSDPTTRQHLQAQHRRYLLEVGFSPEEIAGAKILDPRQIMICEEGRRFRIIVTAHPELLRQQVLTPVNPQAVGVTPRAMPGNGLLATREPASAEIGAQQAWDTARTQGGRAARDAGVALIAARRQGRTRLQ